MGKVYFFTGKAFGNTESLLCYMFIFFYVVRLVPRSFSGEIIYYLLIHCLEARVSEMTEIIVFIPVLL